MNEPLTASPSGERMCRCVKRHSPLPQELHRHHVWPLGKGGPDIADNLRWLCPTVHSSIHRLWRAYDEAGGEPPWAIRRAYGPFACALVAEGWSQMKEHFDEART